MGETIWVRMEKVKSRNCFGDGHPRQRSIYESVSDDPVRDHIRRGMGLAAPRRSGLRARPVSDADILYAFLHVSFPFYQLGQKKREPAFRERFTKALKNEDLKPTLLAFATLLVYLIIFLNLMSFEISTFIYLVVALTIFWKDKLL